MSFKDWRKEWNSKKLNEICTLISRGITPKYTDTTENSVLVLNQRCIREGKVLFENARKNDLKKKKVNEEKCLKDYDVLINSTGVGTLGRVSQIGKVNEIMTVDSHVTIVRANDKLVDNKYLGYAIKSKQRIIESMAEGSTGQTELSRKRLGEEILIKLPASEKEQKAIANMLSTLDEKIEVNNQINKTLENMAKTIFERWFVDFEFPNEDGKPYKSSGGEMVESELGMIPKGWEVKTIGDISKVKGGKRLPKGHVLVNKKTAHPYIRVTDVTAGDIKLNSIQYITDETHDIISRYIITTNDIYISIAGTIGIVGKIREVLNNANLTENMAKITVNSKDLNHLVRLYLKSSLGQHEIQARTVGSTQQKLALTRIRDIPIVVPLESILKRFNELIENIQKGIENRLYENDNLESVRDILLPKLMSGEIRVPLK